MIIKGTLHPSDNVTPTEWTAEIQNKQCHAKLISKTSGEIISEKIMPIEELGLWLFEHKEW